jgi:hypothetical protein
MLYTLLHSFVDGVPKSWTLRGHISGHMKFISMNAKRNNSRKVSAQGYMYVVYIYVNPGHKVGPFAEIATERHGFQRALSLLSFNFPPGRSAWPLPAVSKSFPPAETHQ